MSSPSESSERHDTVVSCGKCSKEWGQEDVVERQECLYKHDVGGYGSVFGDMQEWSVRLCQKCAYELLKPYITWHDS